ncbi:hypothetical protein CDIK_1676 [Cucumispora dikerogammari]|nr:hypothetical protein CDIK_1676 [Cucumispora dikerogammari]
MPKSLEKTIDISDTSNESHTECKSKAQRRQLLDYTSSEALEKKEFFLVNNNSHKVVNNNSHNVVNNNRHNVVNNNKHNVNNDSSDKISQTINHNASNTVNKNIIKIINKEKKLNVNKNSKPTLNFLKKKKNQKLNDSILNIKDKINILTEITNINEKINCKKINLNIFCEKQKYELEFLNKIFFSAEPEPEILHYENCSCNKSIYENTENIKKINISKKNFYKLTSYLFHIVSCLISEKDLRIPIIYTTLHLLIDFENKIYFNGKTNDFLANYQLIGLSILSISLKYFCKNLEKILFSDLIEVSNQSVTEMELKECEMFILKTLNFKVHRNMKGFINIVKNFKNKVLHKSFFNKTSKNENLLNELEIHYLSVCLIFYFFCKEKSFDEKKLIEFFKNFFQINIKENMFNIKNKTSIECFLTQNNATILSQNNATILSQKFNKDFLLFVLTDQDCQNILKKKIFNL